MTNATADYQQAFTLCPARLGDASLLWSWANDPAVRNHGFHPEPISWETHIGWYQDRLRRPGTRIWVLEAAAGPVGQIRYDRNAEGSSAEISYSVAVEHRGKGYGTELIRRTRDLACLELRVRELIGIVKAENTASLRAFLRAGFTSHGPVCVHGRPCYRFTWRAREDQGSER